MKVNKYLVSIKDENYIIISVRQDDVINRPNNADDYDLINNYMEDNYGNREFYVIPLDDLENIEIG